MEPAVKSHLPDSPNRGKYLNHAEVNAITQNPEAVTAVESFLVANGVQFKRGTPLGFINPTLYKAGSSSFNDITSGNNKCCAGSPGSQVCCTQGFTATAGWDPLTGLGSVDYPKFEALFTSSSIEV